MHFYHQLTITTIVCLLISACNSPLFKRNSSDSLSTKETQEILTPTEIEKVSDQLRISSQGIGDAQIGMTYGELKTILGDDFEFKIVSPFMVDIDAIAVYHAGEIQYYILYPAGDTFKDTDIIEIVMTDNSNYLTPEGIGVGTSIQKAEKIYGQASLSYNTNNESREYVTFANQPFSNVYFRSLTDEGFAGIYNEPIEEYNETNTFQDDATINLIRVVKNY